MENQSLEPWVVHKFGGSSVASSERYETVVKIVQQDSSSRRATVVSAMSGVTDALIELTELAKKQDQTYLDKLEALKKKHFATLDEILGTANPALRATLFKSIEDDTLVIRDLLRAISLSRSCSEATLEMIAGHGELWSAQILNACMNKRGVAAQWLDARLVLVVTHGETGPVIDWELSRKKLDAWLERVAERNIVITGYIASTPDGIPTTLKRNGSDFSASIFGALLDASCITIWTDVDGVLSADPRRVPEAVVLNEMSYQEAMELAYFGAKVIHPHTMAPALMKGIPIWIRNTFNPTFAGTKIHRADSLKGVSSNSAELPVKGFTTVDRVALLNLEGTGMIGVPGVANRLFGALREVGVSVIMISQASSEHSICFAVPEGQGAAAKKTVEKAFLSELQQGLIQSVECLTGVSILAAVGDNMVRSPGVAAKFFRALGKAGVNILAIAQGSSERNISVVVDQTQATRALRAAHAGFYLSAQTLSIGILGPGLIGSALMDQLEQQADRLKNEFKIDLRVRAIGNSSRMILGERLLFSKLKQSDKPLDLVQFADHIQAEHVPHSVIIDCTASEVPATHYAAWLKRGIHVITPNKKANSGPLKTYQELRGLTREMGSHYLYEATVGAGLPIITTIRDLIQTGDEIHQIEGVLSGTLSYLFNQFNGELPFSSIVRDAKKLGYTEPDPRDDLSGSDVARKLIILGREIGMSLEMRDIEVENLVPVPLRKSANADEFLDGLASFDAEMARLHREAQEANEVLRYVGSVSPQGKASVKLKRYSKAHPFASLSGTDNIFAFTTRRYHEQPLIIQGPGAGPEVTAGGVFGDLLRLAAYVGSRT
ncbi:MAG: bifunctional aspartate kinase/homoserine dehydrogenase I [Oligoflexia bacterium]|nr:bifunctional aspartate kinase/homoserine dehydrogenase I [Oligoflexia bacterium]